MRGRSLAALVTFVLLLLTTDERSFGLLQDGQQMLSFATAASRFAEAGISRDIPTAVPRSSGDAVSRYGLAASLVEVPAAALSRVLVAIRKGASTAPLFALTQILLLAAASFLIADATRRLGTSERVSALLGSAAVVSTPLLAYGGTDFCEPLQVAAIAGFLDGVVFLRTEARGHGGAEIATGLAAGLAILAKPFLLLLVAPALLLVLRRRVLVPFAACAALFVLFDLYRFGRVFGGYPGEGFTAPLFSGLARLTLLPNKGLVFYAPLVVLAPWGAARLARQEKRLTWALAAGVTLHAGAVACWWAWDGEAGWGPRLLLPALVVLVLFAAMAAAASRHAFAAAAALAVAGFGVNVLGSLVPFGGVYSLAALVPTMDVPSPVRLAVTPAWSPIRLHARLLAERVAGGEVASRLAAGALGDVVPPFVPVLAPPPADEPGVLEFPANPLVEPDEATDLVATPFAWPFWGRSWIAPSKGGVDPYRVALRDQVIRALESGRHERVLALSREMVRTRGGLSAKDAAMAAEAALRAGRPSEADAFLREASAPCHLWLLFVETERGREPGCFAEREREAFRESVSAAVRAGTAVSAWGRKVRRGG